MNKLVVSFIVGLSMFFSSNIFAGDIATERTQAASGAVLIAVQQAAAQLRQIQDTIATFEEIAHEPLNAIDISLIPGADEVFNLLNQLGGVVAQGRALAHTSQNLEDQMRERFRSYEQYLLDLAQGVAYTPQGVAIVNAQGEAVDGMSREAKMFRFREWSETLDQTVNNVLVSHGEQAAEFANTETRIAALRRATETASGRMEALQVGNEIVTESITQMQGLKTLLMEQSSMHGNFFQAKRAAEAEENAAITIVNERIGNLVPQNGVTVGF